MNRYRRDAEGRQPLDQKSVRLDAAALLSLADNVRLGAVSATAATASQLDAMCEFVANATRENRAKIAASHPAYICVRYSLARRAASAASSAAKHDSATAERNERQAMLDRSKPRRRTDSTDATGADAERAERQAMISRTSRAKGTR